jgi:MFS family permease
MDKPAPRLLVFGFLLTFLCGLGQTFFIGLFSGELRDRLELSDGMFGLAYSIATLASAVGMLWGGGLIDRVPVPFYAAGSVGLLAIGYLLLPVAGDPALLTFALFLLRFAGQGLLPHTAVTTIACSFGSSRGRALSLTLLGHPAGEAVLPTIAVLLSTAMGWPLAWILATVILLAITPLLVYLGGTSFIPKLGSRPGSLTSHSLTDQSNDYSRMDVLRDRHFYLFLPTLLAPGFVLTGLFIHQARLMEQKGWDLSWFAASFVVFAGTQALAMLGVGFLIDRLSAIRLIPFYLIPLGLACFVLTLSRNSSTLIPFMAGAGITAGLSTAIVTALWAEIYGVTHLGAIRALGSSGMILATALAPTVFGWLIEHEVRFDSILLACTTLITAAGLLAWIGTTRSLRPGRDALLNDPHTPSKQPSNRSKS